MYHRHVTMYKIVENKEIRIETQYDGAAEIIVQFLYKNEIRQNEVENKGKVWLQRENTRKWCKKCNYDKIYI